MEKSCSSFVLITFGDLIMLASGLNFFAEAPTTKSEISCVGIMAKKGNWYPVESLKAAATALASIIQGYDRRITYGGSMGGYAAIKFSRLLGATEVISLCPQWSIDR